jgi:hypothetical protein
MCHVVSQAVSQAVSRAEPSQAADEAGAPRPSDQDPMLQKFATSIEFAKKHQTLKICN